MYKGFISAFTDHVNNLPDKIACIFLKDGRSEAEKLTFAALGKKAQVIAAYLRQNNFYEKPVILLYPAGIDFIAAFIGCIYAGSIAVPAMYPEDKNLVKAFPIIDATVAHSKAAAILLNNEAEALLKAADNIELKSLANIACINTVSLANDIAHFAPAPITDNAITHLQYVNAASMPRGIITTHSLLSHGLSAASEFWQYAKESVSLNWTPHYHAHGLVTGVLLPLYNGCTNILVPPTVFIANPEYWLQTISKYQVTHTGGPNFCYQHCIEKMQVSSMSNLSLASWKVAINTGEAIKPHTLEDFTNCFAPFGFLLEKFCAVYGMSEYSGPITSTAMNKSPAFIKLNKNSLAEDKVELITDDDTSAISTVVTSCGIPVPGAWVSLIDPITLTEITSSEKIGEIWLSGTALFAGYWQDKQQPFTRLADKNRTYFRTGDTGFMKDGELFLTGRLKEVIIINGKNYDPIDIENTVRRADPLLAEMDNLAFAIEKDNQAQIVILLLPSMPAINNEYHFVALVDNIRQAVAKNHNLICYEVSFVEASSAIKAPFNASLRKAYRDFYLAQKLKFLQQDIIRRHTDNLLEQLEGARLLSEKRSVLKKHISNIIADILGLKEGTVPAASRFFDIGMTSILAVKFSNRLQSSFGSAVDLPATIIFDHPSIDAMISYLERELFIKE